MLTIRDPQLRAIARAHERRFLRRAEKHLWTTLPDECAELGAERVREIVETALVRARGYGLERDYDILRFLNLMMLFGADFDDDDAYPWAREILRDEELEPLTRLELIDQRATAELAAAKGA